MFENISPEQLKNEAELEFKKEFPSINRKAEKSFDVDCYNANDMKTIFMDGFLAGLLWWKPILVENYEGEKSDLQIEVKNQLNSKTGNIVYE